MNTMVAIKAFYKNVRGIISFPHLVIFSISIVLLILTTDGSLVRETLCQVGICFPSEAPDFWNTLLNTFAAGGAISILFYWILVQWPEHRKRQRVKRNLAAQYKVFKISCIENFLAVGDGRFTSGFPEKLLPVVKFRDYFNSDNKRRWYAVHNNMSDYYLDVTLSYMEILRQEISRAMQTIDFSEKDAYEILNRLSHTIVMQRNATRDSDSIKSFLGVFWVLFAGWDFATGYQDVDIIEDIIASI